jgi:FixJ family two-component response regulator
MGGYDKSKKDAKSSAVGDFPPLTTSTNQRLNMVSLDQEALDVCVVDDDVSVLRSTRRLLDSAGWNVEVFTDPSAFLERAALRRPDVAIIDIRMPKMNGFELQARLRRVSPSTRVIILTSKDDPSVRSMATNAGASAFFVKGVDNKEFLAGIKAAADSKTSF